MAADRAIDWTALADWTAATGGFTLTPEQIAQLRVYLDTLLLWNRKLSLVSQNDPAEIITKHVADSLYAASRCADGAAIVDLGSGAGFPGLPIAIARPAARVCLIEARGKKASFLEDACRSASIGNARVCHARIEAAARDPAHCSRYTVATARALTGVAELLALARPFLTPGGCLIAMRSVGQRDAGEPAGAQESRYELPDGTPRRLVILRP